MRIALLTHKVDHLDGQGRVNFEIAKAALNAGHHVTVFAEFCSKEIAEHPRGCFVQSRRRRIPTQLLRNIHYAVKSTRWLTKHRAEFDVVQVNGFVTWAPADVVAVHFVHTAWLNSQSFPFHWSLLNPYACYQRLLTIMNAYYERQAFSAAAKLIAVSSFTASEVVNTGVAANKVFVVNNGVDIEEFCPGPSARDEFGLPPGVPLALFVGDIKTTRKNLGTLLLSMQKLPELHLAVAGTVDGSPYPELAAELGIRDRVHFLGKSTRIAVLMRSADLFVFPSRYEAQPLVLLEALASGLPVVVSDNFQAGSYVRSGGIIYGEADDVRALTTVLRDLLSSPTKIEALRTAARKEAIGMQWTKTADDYLRVYDALLTSAGNAKKAPSDPLHQKVPSL